MNDRHPEFVSIADWLAMSAMGRTAVFRAIARGDIKAIKLGSKTVVDVKPSLGWLRSLPAAQGASSKRKNTA